MSDGNTKRIEHLERSVKELRGTLNRLEITIYAPRQQHEAAITPQNAADQKDDSAKGEPSLIPQVQPSPRDSDKPKKRWYQTLTGWSIFLQIIGIPFAILYAIVTTIQWRDLRRNFEEDERPYIGATTNPPGIFLRLENLTGLTSDIQYTNFGKSPAIHTLVAGRIFVGENALQQADTWFSNLGNHPLSPSDLPIGGGGKQKLEEFPIMQGQKGDSFISDFSNIASAEVRYLIVGRVQYMDIFGKRHWTDVCWWHPYTPSAPPAASTQTFPCATHNEVH